MDFSAASIVTLRDQMVAVIRPQKKKRKIDDKMARVAVIAIVFGSKKKTRIFWRRNGNWLVVELRRLRLDCW